MADRLGLFPVEQRTFRTRVEYIKEIFSHKYTKEEILKSCIEHKLKVSYEQYVESLNRSMKYLQDQNELKVLKQEVKEN